MRTRQGHFVIDDTCIGCGACEHACPGKVDALSRLTDDFLGRFVIDLGSCIDCGFCVPLCPVDCIHDARDGDGGVDDTVIALGAWAEAHESPYDALKKGLGRGSP